MSVLEHIRKRPALVISILGLALVLFIITAVSDNIFSFFGDRDTAVKVDGEKLKYDKWKRASSQISDQLRQQGREDLDISYADEMALQQIIDQELFDKQIEKLGITITDDEMQEYLFGPASIAQAQAQSYGFPSAEDFYAYAYSKENGAENARALWEEMETNLRRQILAAKYQLQLGALTANKLDAKAYYDDNKNVTLNVARVDNYTLPDEDFAVSDAEIKSRYDKEKEAFKLNTEVRLVDYILVTPTASPEDASNASEEVIAAVEKLKTTPGVCYKVNSVEDAQPIYEIAAITRSVVPSQETISRLRQELTDYSVKNANADALKKNIGTTQFHIEQGRVSPDRFAVISQNGQRIPQTVSLVRWALEDAKKGEVSDVIDAGDSFMVIAVSDIYDGDYVPVTDPTVKDLLTQKIRAEKKSAKLVSDYKGKGTNVDEYAEKMNTRPVTVRANYAQNDGGIFRGDAKFLAAVGTAEQGKLVGPVATGTGAVVFEVVSTDNVGGEFDFEQLAPIVGQMFRFDVNNALRANKDIKYKAIRFESRD